MVYNSGWWVDVGDREGLGHGAGGKTNSSDGAGRGVRPVDHLGQGELWPGLVGRRVGLALVGPALGRGRFATTRLLGASLELFQVEEGPSFHHIVGIDVALDESGFFGDLRTQDVRTALD